MKKYILSTLVVLVAILALGGWLWYGKQKENQLQMEQKQQETRNTTQTAPQETSFVTNVDSDVNHWQTKETEFFSIKFPKEWYWLETPPEKPGYFGANAISNNPNFPLLKYSDIGMATASDYSPLVLTNDTEVVVTDHGWPTSNSGTPLDSINWQIERVKKDVNPNGKCDAIGNVKNGPLTAYCSFVTENHQKVQTYYIAYNTMTFAFTARTTEKNTSVNKDLLEKIAKNFIVKSKSFN